MWFQTTKRLPLFAISGRPPSQVLEASGADALRLYLMSSPAVRAERLLFREAGVQGVVKDVLLPWHNAYRFLVRAL